MHAAAQANVERLRQAEEENRRMRLQIERLMEERLCCVCMEAPRDSCLQPCGHSYCAARLQQAAQLQRCQPLCPACRVAFASARRIFVC